MKPNDVARLVNVHTNTVRNWTSDFAQFFSTGGQGGDRHVRDLDDNDVRVVGFINQLKKRGATTDEVIAALRDAQHKGFENLPSPAREETVVPMAVVPRQAAEEAVRGGLNTLEQVREQMQARLDELKALVEYERMRVADERQKVEQGQDIINNLNRKIGELEGKLSILERQNGNNGGGR